MVHCGDTPSYRSVRIKLTPEQEKKLSLKQTYSFGGVNYYEQFSKCILELAPKETEEAPGTIDNTPKATICPKCGGKTTVRPFGDGTFKCFACFHIW